MICNCGLSSTGSGHNPVECSRQHANESKDYINGGGGVLLLLAEQPTISEGGICSLNVVAMQNWQSSIILFSPVLYYFPEK
jgi:hypothetical protein